jgi:polar amino acid transport system substrate-binding protein
MVKPENVNLKADQLKTFGTIRGFTAFEYQAGVKSGKLSVVYFDDFKTLLENAIEGKIDGAYINISVAIYQLQTQLHKPNALVFHNNMPFIKSTYRFSSIKHPEVIDEFNTFLHTNQKIVKDLKEKFGVLLPVSKKSL